MFDTVLIANRGEIALRIVRTCRDMGITTVVVHSGVDRDSAAVRAADHRVNIGPADPHRSYLYPPAIIEAALQTGAQAIHPGYGFLSEDPDFATICAENGLVFIGPDPDVMARLGDKSTARRIMAEAGLPVVPGSDRPVSTADEAAEVAQRIGFPLIVKAVAGGGGRGMSVVRDIGALLPTFRATRAAAQVAFGDNRVYLEQYLYGARHIEIQILADAHGNVVHLGERDCSVQRRHQKLIEESPAPRLPADLADRLAAHAVAGARAVGYRGAGTFEFLVRGEDAAFIEVNSRIQVEHPVTEMVTGVDIVREQLLVAAGEPLGPSSHGWARRGAAVECRINAEDPNRAFVPCPGRLTEFTAPAGPFVRVDTHAFPGSQARPEYDSLLAKVVTWGQDRDQALARMRRALRELRVEGPGMHTTAPLLAEVLDEPDFVAGTHDTTLLDRRAEPGRAEP
ncbi:biotin carboxylase N-terminal domain-containing protein [Embleya sp. NBC_00896]|uniref:acetyl-CoA carboxylase biotin carboxylase subunit n=1 Tax=Embleya sp. NBC_00896 TaxID=2975961 RepID=UPI002F90D09C|nr:ATP-grasp domain-containing protein [Embleya sp. NBC_00896]